MAATTMQKTEAQAVSPERTHGGPAYRPSVDILDANDELRVMADVPGAQAEDIDVQFENGVLTLHAKVKPRRSPTAGNFALREYGIGDFVRTFQVGEGIDASRISAVVANGVLTLHLPKTPAAKLRKIEVKGG